MGCGNGALVSSFTLLLIAATRRNATQRDATRRNATQRRQRSIDCRSRRKKSFICDVIRLQWTFHINRVVKGCWNNFYKCRTPQLQLTSKKASIGWLHPQNFWHQCTLAVPKYILIYFGNFLNKSSGIMCRNTYQYLLRTGKGCPRQGQCRG